VRVDGTRNIRRRLSREESREENTLLGATLGEKVYLTVVHVCAPDLHDTLACCATSVLLPRFCNGASKF